MKTCTVCEVGNVTEIHRINLFPIFMGATTVNSEDYIFRDLIYGTCDKCSTLQIMDLVPLDLLYQDNHNTEVVGKTWECHNTDFAKFIKASKPKVVVEIGSPSATIFKKLQNEPWLDKWYSIEPNPADLTSVSAKFILKKAFLDDTFSFEKHRIEKPNAIVMSHVFEHLYNPREILNVLYENLNIGDEVFISIPNMEYISDNKLMPPSGLHFEHTFYLELSNAVFLFQTSGFEVQKMSYFQDHSFFIHAKKSYHSLNPNYTELKTPNDKNVEMFKKTIKSYDSIIAKIKPLIAGHKGDVYLYGSHFPAQYLIFNGLGEHNLKGCLDQSKTKIGKKLYGTELEVFSPEILRGKENVLVVCYMGPYTKEIKKTILEINDKVIFV